MSLNMSRDLYTHVSGITTGGSTYFSGDYCGPRSLLRHVVLYVNHDTR